MLDRGLVSGTMAPRRFGALGGAADFLLSPLQPLALAAPLAILGASLAGATDLLLMPGPLSWLVITHATARLYVVVHTLYVVLAHAFMVTPDNHAFMTALWLSLIHI